MTSNIQKTVLHEWHAAHGGKLVDFAGWEMPVQYPSGAIKEHLATRRGAGLFDVSHMGRFMARGPGAERFLQRALTNNAKALRPGTAHYTFVATESGGAMDDAYVYRLAQEAFLVVVNAGNADKVWRWFAELNEGGDCDLEDVTEALCMMSLQGPAASRVLEQLVDKARLPENKRTRLATAPLNGHELVMARTGYPGEAVCFELFVPRAATVDLW